MRYHPAMQRTVSASHLRSRRSRRSRGILALAAALTILAALPARGQEEEAAATPPPLAIEAVTVEPASPGPDTLCRLAVKLRNAGTSVASQLGFTVTINGQELAPYRNQLYMFPLAAGATQELQLYNFWSSETSRPAPADGKLAIEVKLVEARWMTIGMEDDVEVWTPGDAVPGLPVTTTLTVQMTQAE